MGPIYSDSTIFLGNGCTFSPVDGAVFIFVRYFPKYPEEVQKL
jgi:hypothetical protein